MSSCRYCFATIVFVRLDSGKPIPVDPHPQPDRGNVAASKDAQGRLSGHVISGEKPLQAHQSRYVPHRAACKPDQPKVTASERAPALFD